mgnify:CR=1 FL=1
MIKKKNIVPMLYLLPVVALMLVFMYIPIVQNFWNSMFDWSIYKPQRSFVGLKYFKELAKDKVFWTCLWNNTLYALISLVGQVGVGLVIASVLESKSFRNVSGFFRTVYFAPSVISFMVVGLLWQLFFNPIVGPFNSIIGSLGFDTSKLNVLGNPKTALFGVIFASQWMYFGYMAMLLIIGIQKVPEELYEAASIDGANAFDRFLHITIPGIKEMILVDCIITVIGSFKLFDEVFIMTNGGPGYSSEVISTYLYRTAFRADQMGYASALAVVLFFITFVLSLVQMKLSKTGEE